MAIASLEAKIGKILRKANRLKALHAKLEHVDGFLSELQEWLVPFSGTSETELPEHQQQEKHRLEGLRELCILHKLKFQIDMVLDSLRSNIQRLSHEPQLQTAEHITPLLQRIHAILAIDPDHLEARELFHLLKTEYPQYIQDLADGRPALSIAPYQIADMRIIITVLKTDLEKHEALFAKYPLYQIPLPKSSDTTPQECQMRFSLKDLDDFARFHEELRMKASYRISLNNRPIQEQHFSDWFHCYARFRKAQTPSYCYGASPLTFNIFGCHKLYTPDIGRQVDACWFSHGTLDLDSGFFFLSYAAILQQLRHHLEYCGFCPALTQKKISVGLSLLPFALNPECDPRWRYWPPRGKPAGVIPTGHDIAIAPPNSDFAHLDPSELIEVGPTPYIEKLLMYLETHNLDDLSTRSYQGLSTCVHCGVPYKPHTMVCSKCKTDFWKYALHDLDQILFHLRSTTPVTFSSGPQQAPSASSDGGPHSIPSQQPQLPEEEVSFEQLWSDPQVQQMLSNAPSTPENPASQPTSSKTSATDSPQKIVQQAPTSDLERHRYSLQEIAKSRSASFPERPSPRERLQFHEKIWSLISKKYRERRAIESAFSPAQSPKTSTPETPASASTTAPSSAEPQQSLPSAFQQLREADARASETRPQQASPEEQASASELAPENAALLNAIKSLKPRQKSELSKRGVVRVVYIATMDKDVCPLCAYLDGMVMDPDDPATDIFSPPLYPGCTCRREYVLKTEKPQNWPRVTFKFPPKELLVYLDKGQS